MVRILMSANLISKCTFLLPKIAFTVGSLSTVSGGMLIGAGVMKVRGYIEETNCRIDSYRASVGIAFDISTDNTGTVCAPGCKKVYTAEDADRDIKLARGCCWKNTAKTLLPGILLSIGGITLTLTAAVHVMNVATNLAAELATAIQVHELYRKRTATWVGEDTERLINQGYSREDVTTTIENDDGTTKTIVTQEPIKDPDLQDPIESPFAFVFDHDSEAWSPNRSRNEFILRNIEHELNVLRTRFGVITGVDIQKKLGNTGRKICEKHINLGSIYSREPFTFGLENAEWYGENGAEVKIYVPLYPLLGQLDKHNAEVDAKQAALKARRLAETGAVV